MQAIVHPVLLATALAAAVSAQIPVREIVPADSKFVFALDLQAAIDLIGRDLLRQGIVRKVHEESDGKLRADWDEVFVQEWGFDPFTDLRGFVLFGDKGPHDGATAALITSGRIDATLDRLRDVGALETVEKGGIEVMQVVPGKVLALFGAEGEMEDADKPIAFVHVHAFGGRNDGGRAILIGEKSDGVVRAAKALRGGKTISGEQSKLGDSMRRGDIMFVDVSGEMADMLGENPASKLTSKARRATIQLGQREGKLTLRAVIETAEEKDAKQIAALVNGLKALLALAEPGEDIPQPALDALMGAQAKAEDNSVTLEIEVPTELLEQAMQEVHRELGGEDNPRPKKASSTRRERAIR